MNIITLALAGLSLLTAESAAHKTPSLRSSLAVGEEQLCYDAAGDSNCFYKNHNEGGKPCCTNGSRDLVCNYVGGGAKDPNNFVCQNPSKDSFLEVEEEQLCYDAVGDSNCFYKHHNEGGKPCCTNGSRDLVCNYVGGGAKDPNNFVCQNPSKDSFLEVEEEQLCFDAEGDQGCYYARFNEGGKPCCSTGNKNLVCNYVGGGAKDPNNFVCEINGKDSLVDVEEEQLCFDAEGDQGCYYARFNEGGKPCCSTGNLNLVCNYVGGGAKDPNNFVCEINGEHSLVKSA